jgi:hypothetical protein
MHANRLQPYRLYTKVLISCFESSSIWVQRRRSTSTKNLSTHLKTHLSTETGIPARMNAHALLRRSHMGVKRLLEKYAVCGGGGISRR